MAQEQIRTREDGTIDTAFYMARGRRMRSEKAHELASSGAAGAEKSLLKWLRALSPRREAQRA